MIDIEYAQVIHKDVLFEKAVNLFNKNACRDLSYGWYEGHVEGLSSHSNLLESSHKHIKKDPQLAV